MMTENRENVNNAAAVDGGVNNAAAMREALVRLRDIALASLEKKRREGVDTVNLAEIIVHHCESALSAPPRNCDVGTAEEQTKRFRRFCDNTKCQYCNITVNKGSCSFNRAQMPYNEEGGAK